AGVDDLRTSLWMNAGSRCGARLSRWMAKFWPARIGDPGKASVAVASPAAPLRQVLSAVSRAFIHSGCG
ncbi:hypothetical protein, partial [Stenotrophomonas acidaminiphila]|uniref:hypothetical protein n=1 Tax=Stenotrophomonas acidaminiphila TaxID=128780 RepID=UPI0028A8F2BD